MTNSFINIQIRQGSIVDLDEIYLKFKIDFPPEERKEYNQIKKLMETKRYKLLICQDLRTGGSIGYAFIYIIEKPKALWLDYIAVDNLYQGLGYGTLFFNKILEIYGKDMLGMFIELEIPDTKNRSTRLQQQRRIRFYERLGAKKLRMDYRLPTQKEGVPMNLYFKSHVDTHYLRKETIRKVIITIFAHIHSDMKYTNDVMNKFINTIKDEHF